MSGSSGVVGSLADVAGGEAREPRPLGQQVVDVVGGDQLGAGLAVHVDELGEQELDAVLGDDSPDVVGGGGLPNVVRAGESLGHGAGISARTGAAQWS
jgi:hypothetical protein